VDLRDYRGGVDQQTGVGEQPDTLSLFTTSLHTNRAQVIGRDYLFSHKERNSPMTREMQQELKATKSVINEGYPTRAYMHAKEFGAYGRLDTGSNSRVATRVDQTVVVDAISETSENGEEGTPRHQENGHSRFHLSKTRQTMQSYFWDSTLDSPVSEYARGQLHLVTSCYSVKEHVN